MILSRPSLHQIPVGLSLKVLALGLMVVSGGPTVPAAPAMNSELQPMAPAIDPARTMRTKMPTTEVGALVPVVRSEMQAQSDPQGLLF